MSNWWHPKLAQHAGDLKFLGNNLQKTNQTKYSIIEIWDETLKNVTIGRSLDNYLQRALEMSGPTTLRIAMGMIYAVTLPDGKTYLSEGAVSYRGVLFQLLAGLVFLPIVVGLVFLYGARWDYQMTRQLNAMRAQGAIAI